MEDYEVELIDYMRILWWGKWIILGCLVVAVGLSALFVGLQPTTYTGSTEILLREYVTAALAGHHDETATTMASISLATVMEFSLAGVKNAVPGIVPSLTNDRITLSRSNAASTNAVREALAQAEAVLEQQLPLVLAEELGHLTVKTRLRESGLLAQLEILQQRLHEEQAVASVPLSEALAQRIAELESQLAQVQVLLDTLEAVNPGDLLVLSPVGEPTIRASETSLKTMIAVAGFLGLMTGVLLTFFVHYLLQIRTRERQAL